jgi:hypothetical protein
MTIHPIIFKFLYSIGLTNLSAADIKEYETKYKKYKTTPEQKLLKKCEKYINKYVESNEDCSGTTDRSGRKLLKEIRELRAK